MWITFVDNLDFFLFEFDVEFDLLMADAIMNAGQPITSPSDLRLYEGYGG